MVCRSHPEDRRITVGNTRISRLRALGVPLTAAALTLTVSPAHAADGDLKLNVAKAVSIAAAPASGDAPATPLLVNNSGSLAKDVHKDIKLTFDASGLSGVATFAPDLNWGSTCTTQGSVYSCTVPETGYYPTFNQQLQPKLTPVKGAPLGSVGHLKITQTWDGGPVNTADTAVYIGGPDLRVTTGEDVSGLKPGSTFKEVIKVENKGSMESGQLVVAISAAMSLTFNQHFANCEYAERPAGSNDQSSWTDSKAAICTIDTSVKPGETVTIDPIEFGVGPEALISDLDITVLPGEGDGSTPWIRSWYQHFEKPQSGPRLTAGRPETPGAKPGQPNLPEPHNSAVVQIQTENTADFSAAGAWAPSDGGKKGVLTVGVHNAGPASVGYVRSGNSVAVAVVELPAGVSVDGKAPADCWATPQAPNKFMCGTDYWTPNGFQRNFTFPLTVSDPAVAPQAKITVTTEDGVYGGSMSPPSFDKNAANNVVTVALGTTANGSTPTGPTAHPTPTNPRPSQAQPSGSASASAARPASTSASASASAAGGGLASTGASGIGPIAGAGVAAIVLGGVLAVVARRRKAGAHQ